MPPRSLQYGFVAVGATTCPRRCRAEIVVHACGATVTPRAISPAASWQVNSSRVLCAQVPEIRAFASSPAGGGRAREVRYAERVAAAGLDDPSHGGERSPARAATRTSSASSSCTCLLVVEPLTKNSRSISHLGCNRGGLIIDSAIEPLALGGARPRCANFNRSLVRPAG